MKLLFLITIIFNLAGFTPYSDNSNIWAEDTSIPVINYHRFLPDSYEYSTGMKRRLGDFSNDLQRLYDAGYTLISLDDMIDKTIEIPSGRKPLVLTIDDAYFADQLWLTPEGEPSINCGIGVLYQFYKEHPDFGFEVAMFANFGDKYYGNVYRNGWWYLGEGWEDDLAKAIVWGIEHGIMPYNHLYIHPRLDLTEYAYIQDQARLNDEALRDLLQRVDRLDLAKEISNYIALPYGKWASTEAGCQRLIDYIDPEGKPVKAVFEAGYEYMPKYAMPFSEDFDVYHIPRMAGMEKTIEVLLTLN